MAKCHRSNGPPHRGQTRDALWRETLIDASIFREWMISIGRRDAFARICPPSLRAAGEDEAVGLVEDHTCKLPITQSEFGDALGLSTVHVNRTLQEIRKARAHHAQGRHPQGAGLGRAPEGR
jgi:hypothetical protein